MRAHGRSCAEGPRALRHGRRLGSGMWKWRIRNDVWDLGVMWVDCVSGMRVSGIVGGSNLKKGGLFFSNDTRWHETLFFRLL